MKMKLYKRQLLAQKKRYFFLISITIIIILIGFLFFFLISDGDKKIVTDLLDTFFISITENNIDKKAMFLKGLLSNATTILLIWILGISIIGIPIILLLYLMKCFILGFSISSIISSYGLKGVFRAILYVFPHQLINIVMLLLLTFYSVSFSIKLVQYLFFHKNINFRIVTSRYIKILILVFIISIISLLYEVFISSYFFQLLIS